MTDLDAALRELRARDSTAAEYADGLWRMMRGGAAHPTRTTQYDVQQLVWGTMAAAIRRPDVPEFLRDAKRSSLALADLLDLLGHERYGEICRSATTQTILDTAITDPELCAELIGEAWLRSGVRAPDTPVLAWSLFGGPLECALHAVAGRLLEDAVLAGEIPADGSDPEGLPERVAITVRFLTEPRPDGEEPWLVKVIDERLDRWIIGNGSQTRRELLVRVRPEVRSVPPSNNAVLPAVEHVLMRCQEGKGIRLTRSGYFPTALVAELVALLPACAGLPVGGKSESHWPPVMTLRTVLEDCKLIKDHVDDHIRLTPAGADAVVADDGVLSAIGAGLVSMNHPVFGAIEEVVLAALLLEDGIAGSRIVDKAMHVVTEEKWAADGEPISREQVDEACRWFLRKLFALDVVASDWGFERVELTEPGRTVAFWGLRARLMRRGVMA